MSDGKIQIDNDWKKQAQEEKRKLAEQEAAAKQAPAAQPAAKPRRNRAEGLVADFDALVQSILTQAYYYLGDLSPRGTEPNIQLDMAKHQLDLLAVLEDRTRNNLSAEEKQMLDASLYEVRTRFVGVAANEIV